MSRSNLRPPKNLHRKIPKVCAFCAYFYHEGTGSSSCRRVPDPEEALFDIGDGKYYEMVCDRFAWPT